MPDLLLEVGTEEMPAGAVEVALQQLKAAVDGGLKEARLGADPVRVYGTPRRLIAMADAVPARQPDQQREARGPSRAVAYDRDGNATGAAIGFARKQGVPVDSLEIISTPQGEYVTAHIVDEGKPAGAVLGSILADAVRGLFFPKMMRWGEGSPRFVRPIRWILALLDGDVVPMEIAGVASGRRSRGHRFLSPEEFEVPSPQGFLETLHAAYVAADSAERRESIRAQADALAVDAGGSIPWDEALLDENNWLVEWPTALLGSFDPAYLELPRPVLVTAMKKHQRFFPVEDSAGRLLPRFVSIRNGGTDALDIVREGNERVLTARFADARFFYEQDRQSTLEEMAAGLSRILFQEKLGTLAEKRSRLELLAAAMAEARALSPEERGLAVRAASLCKADLASQMVMELPALQGIVGREYALAQGEDLRVADAVSEHYRPRSAGDPLPASPLGRLLAVADRMDTLVGYVGIGVLPSGSSDPYGLRRAAQGVVQILAEEPNASPLVELEVLASRGYREVNGLDFELDPLCNDLGGLFDQRLSAYLEERGIRYDLVDAALSGGPIYSTLVYAIVRRAGTLQALADDPEFVPTVNAAGRVANILRSAHLEPTPPPVPGKEGIHGSAARSVERAVSVLQTEARKVSRAALAEPAERRLLEQAERTLPEVARRATEYNFEGVYRALGPLRPYVDTFFDDVLVMAEDSALRRNRLSLLCFVDALYKTLADFTRVVVA